MSNKTKISVSYPKDTEEIHMNWVSHYFLQNTKKLEGCIIMEKYHWGDTPISKIYTEQPHICRAEIVIVTLNEKRIRL